MEAFLFDVTVTPLITHDQYEDDVVYPLPFRYTFAVIVEVFADTFYVYEYSQVKLYLLLSQDPLIVAIFIPPLYPSPFPLED